jgi:hypothetical protein
MELVQTNNVFITGCTFTGNTADIVGVSETGTRLLHPSALQQLS